MLTILIRMMLKVFGRKSPIFFVFIYCNAFDLFFCFLFVFFWFTNRLLFDFVL